MATSPWPDKATSGCIGGELWISVWSTWCLGWGLLFARVWGHNLEVDLLICSLDSHSHK